MVFRSRIFHADRGNVHGSFFKHAMHENETVSGPTTVSNRVSRSTPTAFAFRSDHNGRDRCRNYYSIYERYPPFTGSYLFEKSRDPKPYPNVKRRRRSDNALPPRLRVHLTDSFTPPSSSSGVTCETLGRHAHCALCRQRK